MMVWCSETRRNHRKAFSTSANHLWHRRVLPQLVTLTSSLYLSLSSLRCANRIDHHWEHMLKIKLNRLSDAHSPSGLIVAHEAANEKTGAASYSWLPVWVWQYEWCLAAIKLPRSYFLRGFEGEMSFPRVFLGGCCFFSREAPAVTQVTVCALACGMEIG